jgi:hypothetical protein
MQDPLVVPQAQAGRSTAQTGEKFQIPPPAPSTNGTIQGQLGVSVPQTGWNIQVPTPPPPAANAPVYRHVIRSRVKKVAALRQAASTCWDHLRNGNFPTTKTKDGKRDNAAWLPYVKALGLKKNVFPKIHVQGKKAQHHVDGGKTLVPSWAFLAYVLIAVSPKGSLSSNAIYHLGLAWCSGIKARNQSCRKGLIEDMFRPENGFHRLSNVGEPVRTREEKKDNGKPGTDSGMKTPPGSSSQSSNSASSSPPRSSTPGPKWTTLNYNPSTKSSEKPTAPAEQTPSSSRPSSTRERKSTKHFDEYYAGAGNGKEHNGAPGLQTTESRKRHRVFDPSADDEQDYGGSGPQTTASRKRARIISNSKFGSQHSNDESNDNGWSILGLPEPSEENFYQSGVRTFGKSNIGNANQWRRYHNLKELAIARAKSLVNNPNWESYMRPAFPKGYIEPGLDRTGQPRGVPFMTTVTKGFSLQQFPGDEVRYGEKITLAAYKADVIACPNRKIDWELTEKKKALRKAKEHKNEDLVKKLKEQILELEKEKEEGVFSKELEEGFSSTTHANWKPRDDRDLYMLTKIDKHNARKYHEGLVGSIEWNKERPNKLMPLEQFSMDNPMGGLFCESNERGST